MKRTPMNLKARRDYYAKRFGDWRTGTRFREGYTRYGRCEEQAHYHEGKSLWHWSTGTSAYHLGYADEIDHHINHRGWYTDTDHCGETIRGVVLRIRTSRGTIYAPGYYSSDSDGHGADLTKGECVMVPKGADEDEHKQAARDVAGWADTMAQTLAEEQQGYNAVYNAERTVEDTLTELAETAESARAVVAALREAKEQGAQGVNLCLLLRASLDRARRALHSAINEVREARDNEAQVRRHTGITERVG